MSEETKDQGTPEQPPTTADQTAPSVSLENVPSSDSPEASALPSANAPDPTAVSSETNVNAAKPAAAKKAAAAKPADGEAAPAKAKKEKAPALEDKPFEEFIQQDYLPALKNALAKQGLDDALVSLEKQKIPVAGMSAEDCWQVIGRWQNGKRQFNLYFPKADINGPRGFSCSDSASKPSTVEPFLIDERKITLDLMVFGVVQRLNAQKWLALN